MIVDSGLRTQDSDWHAFLVTDTDAGSDTGTNTGTNTSDIMADAYTYIFMGECVCVRVWGSSELKHTNTNGGSRRQT